MRCYICNAVLKENEVKWNRDHEQWDPCGTCLEIINEVFEPLPEETIVHQIEVELEEGILVDGPDELV